MYMCKYVCTYMRCISAFQAKVVVYYEISPTPHNFQYLHATVKFTVQKKVFEGEYFCCFYRSDESTTILLGTVWRDI